MLSELRIRKLPSEWTDNYYQSFRQLHDEARRIQLLKRMIMRSEMEKTVSRKLNSDRTKYNDFRDKILSNSSPHDITAEPIMIVNDTNYGKQIPVPHKKAGKKRIF